MACNESDEKSRIQIEIRQLEERKANLEASMNDALTSIRMLNHRIADLKYDLRQITSE